MDVAQLAPWVSLIASVCSLLYVGWQVSRQAGGTADGEQAAGAGSLFTEVRLFFLVALTMLFFAGTVHYLLWLASLSALAVPVWLLAVFVIVVVAVVETMPGATLEERVENFTDRVAPDADVAVDVEKHEESKRE